ncbi:class I SAM-dependent methyltransferase [Sphingomonas sp.]|uniref:O-methyltransferase n=1 Tax=Sphingomonas sp. TaxID=28214 RepID=UPI001B1BBCC2|nr:class I SAM-dependent methyltransferase [Sphingomonas sp.]MBO9712542.1 class I SAM-dependent methyltransferase [Sphingomonas sp.]
MTLFQSAPLAGLIARLFAEEAAQRARLETLFADVDETEQARLMQSRDGYRELYHRMREIPLAVSPETGQLLYMLARAAQVRTIVEFGTSFGISTIHLAAALRDNGGGHLITSEFEPGKVAHARANLTEGGLADLVEFREGDALETLAKDLPDAIDLLLLDGAKALYPDVLALAEPRLRSGAIVVADNADWCPDYLAQVRDPGGRYLSFPFGPDVEVSVLAR